MPLLAFLDIFFKNHIMRFCLMLFFLSFYNCWGYQRFTLMVSQFAWLFLLCPYWLLCFTCVYNFFAYVVLLWLISLCCFFSIVLGGGQSSGNYSLLRLWWNRNQNMCRIDGHIPHGMKRRVGWQTTTKKKACAHTKAH